MLFKHAIKKKLNIVWPNYFTKSLKLSYINFCFWSWRFNYFTKDSRNAVRKEKHDTKIHNTNCQLIENKSILGTVYGSTGLIP